MFQIEITERAIADADAAHEWMVEHISVDYATKWYRELFEQIETLARQPARCPIARESAKFPEEIRELIFGKRRHKHKYRILFAIRGQEVVVLYVYHSSRKELDP
jgi:plasmid stabilization system protein ParE